MKLYTLDWCSYSVLIFPFLISQGGAGPGGRNGPPGDPGRGVRLYYQSIYQFPAIYVHVTKMEQLNRLSKISEWVLIGYLVFIYESTSTNILKNILGREMDKIIAVVLGITIAWLHTY